MYQAYPQQPGLLPQQPSPPVMGSGAAPLTQQPYGQQPSPPQQFQQQFQPYQQQANVQQFPQGQPQQYPPQQQQQVPTPQSDRESYQTALPPTVTPGWNDPPAMLPTAGSTPNRLTNMRRRPVDPSITGNVGYGAAPQTANPYGTASPYGAAQQDPQQYQQQQYQAYQQQQQPQYGQQQQNQQYGQQYPGAGGPQQHYGM